MTLCFNIWEYQDGNVMRQCHLRNQPRLFQTRSQVAEQYIIPRVPIEYRDSDTIKFFTRGIPAEISLVFHFPSHFYYYI